MQLTKMKQEYQTWTDKYNREHTTTHGQCDKATKEMLEAFPELIRARGHVQPALSAKPCEHWWLKDDTGNIIDPTAKQFGYILEYEEWNEGAEEPTGRCLNCGNYCYHGRSTCSDVCYEEFVASLNHV